MADLPTAHTRPFSPLSIEGVTAEDGLCKARLAGRRASANAQLHHLRWGGGRWACRSFSPGGGRGPALPWCARPGCAALPVPSSRPWPLAPRAGAYPYQARAHGCCLPSPPPRRAPRDRGSRLRAPTDLREALISPQERLQVGGVVEIERCLRELHNPPTRRSAPRPREQPGVAIRVREPNDSCGSRRPVVQPPEVMRYRGCTDVVWEPERWQPAGRNSRLTHRIDRLPRNLHGRVEGCGVPPVRACAFPYGHQHIRCRSEAGSMRWQRRMHFKVRRVPCGKALRVFQPKKSHRVVVVIVTKERKPSVCSVRRDPLIAMR